jgi:hypothetical protein
MSHPNNLYKEKWVVPFFPLVFFLPCFYTYSVVVTQEEVIFGYGMFGPWKGITAQRILRRDIQKVFTGSWNWKENLTNFRGWGIRFGKIATESQTQMKHYGWAYNATNGPFVVIQVQGDKCYQFVTKEPEIVKQLLTTTSTTDE